jgi:hypothetical protein
MSLKHLIQVVVGATVPHSPSGHLEVATLCHNVEISTRLCNADSRYPYIILTTRIDT